MKKKLLIILIIIAVMVIFVLLFGKNIIYYYYDKKYDNIERIEKNLTYNEEGNLIEESSVTLNNLNVSLSNVKYTNENELDLEFKFLNSKPLNTVGYILRLYTEEHYFGDYFMGPTSLSSTQWIMNTHSFCKKTYNDIYKNRELISKTFNHENILEENTMLHKITFHLPEEFKIKDKLNVVLLDLNYQNVDDKNFYKITDKLSEIKYTIDNL